MKNEQYCIINDDEGHRWICPTSRREEVRASIQAVEAYWNKQDWSTDCPDALTEGLTMWEGEDLTFSNPHLNGKAVT